jgi:PAS domain S-box-containing protein
LERYGNNPDKSFPMSSADEELDHILTNMPAFLIANLAAICFAALVQAALGSISMAGFWALPGIASTTFGLLIWSRVRFARNGKRTADRSRTAIILGSLVIGLHWGASGPLLLELGDPANVVFTVAMATIAVLTGATTIAASMTAVFAMVLPIAAGIAAPMFQEQEHWPIGIAILFYFGTVLYLVSRQRLLLARAVRQDNENRLLISDLRQARDQIHDAIESIPLGIMFFDSEDRLVLSNQQMRDLFPGMKESLLPGTKFQALLEKNIESGSYPVPHGMTVEDTVSRRLSHHRSGAGSFEITTEEGRILRGSDTATSNNGIITLFTDITELRVRETELRQNRDRLSLVLDATDDGFWEFENAKDRTYWSNRLRQILGVENSAISASISNQLALVHPSDRYWVEDSYQRTLSGASPTFDIEYRIIRPDGKTRWIHDRGKAEKHENGNVARVAGAVADITDRIVRKRERDAALDALERQNIELEQFVSIASHDLQEPLRMMTGYLDLLRRRAEGKLDEDGMEYLEYSLQNGKRMQQLIRDLLDYSRIGTRGNEMEEVSLSEIVEDAKLNLTLSIEETGADIRIVGELPNIIGDRSQLVQLFQNLIGNALKYRREDSAPMIAVSAVNNRDEWIFRVTDNGIGIDPSDQTRIFGIFQRLHGRSAYPGTGMGLAICRKIVERHLGRIWVESELGEGAAFCFTIPVVTSRIKSGSNAA